MGETGDAKFGFICMFPHFNICETNFSYFKKKKFFHFARNSKVKCLSEVLFFGQSFYVKAVKVFISAAIKLHF